MLDDSPEKSDEVVQQMISSDKSRSFGPSGFFNPIRKHFRRKPRISARPRFRPTIQALEQRIALAAITWNVATAGGGGDWDRGYNWVGGVVPGPSDTAIIPRLGNAGIVYLNGTQPTWSAG